MSESIPIRGSISRLTTEHSTCAQWIKGHVITAQGIVAVFSGGKHTALSYVHDRKLHTMNFEGRSFTEDELIRRAAKFVRDTTHHI